MKCSIKFSCLEEASRKVIRISRMVAMFPLDDDCRFSPKLSIPTVILLFALSIHSVYWISIGEILKKIVFQKYLYILRKLLLTLCCVIMASKIILEQDKLRLIINNLKMIDSGLGILNKNEVTILNPIKYLFNLFVSVFVVTIQSFTKPPIYWIELHIETILLGIFINQVLAFCDLIMNSLQHISEFPFSPRNKHYTLRTKLYNIIEDTIDNLNDTYGVGVFLIIIVFFITILHQIFQFSKKKLDTTWEIINAFLISMCDLWLILQLILASSDVASKATMFNKTLYNELLKDESKDTFNSEEIYFHFERVKDLRLDADGFFIVDRHLVISMMITGTTYLTILLQYSD